MTSVGSLYVNLGIKGSEKTIGALGGVEKGLKGLGSMSLEAKAAIVGAMYALEQLFSKSGHEGTNLTNFNASLGVSTKTLQQYQYAARQVGVSNEETASTFKTLQETMTKTALGKGAPEGLGRVAMLTGGMSSEDIKRYMEHPEQLLQKLQEYAQKEKNIGVRNQTLSSFGVSGNMLAGLARNAFTSTALSKAPTYNDKEIKALDRANIGWSNLGTKIQMAIGHLNAAHGGQLVKDFSSLVDIGLRFANVLLNIVDKLHIFEAVQKIFPLIAEGASSLISDFAKIGDIIGSFFSKANIFGTLSNHLITVRNQLDPLIGVIINLGQEFVKFADKTHLFESLGKNISNIMSITESLLSLFIKLIQVLVQLGEKFKIFETIGDVIGDVLNVGGKVTGAIAGGLSGENKVAEKSLKKQDVGGFLKGTEEIGMGIFNQLPNVFNALTSGLFKSSSPTSSLLPSSASVARPKTSISSLSKNSTQNINVNQNLNFAHEGKNAKQTAHSVHKSVNDALRQIPSIRQGS